MAGKKYTKRKRMPVRRRRGGKRSTTLLNATGLSPIPSRYITKMKYAQAFTITGTGLQTYQWNLNSLFSPARTAGAYGQHQPYGWDQLTPLYNRYRVFGVSYVITVLNDEYNIQYAVLPSNNATPPISNCTEARENPRTQFAIQNVGGTVKKIKGYVNLPALTGRTKQQYMADDAYQSINSLSPSETLTLNLYMQGANDDTGSLMSHTVNAVLVFHCELFDPISVDQS